MSGFVKIPGASSIEKMTPKEIDLHRLNRQSANSWKRLFNPKMPEVPEIPAAPTVDQAQQNRDQQDRLRRRRGVLANIFGGGQSSAASSGAGTKSLLGQ